MKDWKKIVKENTRYKGFTILENPERFCDRYAGKDISYIQVHSTQIAFGDIVGFCGVFEWKNGEVISLDGDSYNKEMQILGYDWNDDSDPNHGCLDILVGNDW